MEFIQREEGWCKEGFAFLARRAVNLVVPSAAFWPFCTAGMLPEKGWCADGGTKPEVKAVRAERGEQTR